MDNGFLDGGGDAVSADAADLALLVLVVVPANPAGILSLSLPHTWIEFLIVGFLESLTVGIFLFRKFRVLGKGNSAVD